MGIAGGRWDVSSQSIRRRVGCIRDLVIRRLMLPFRMVDEFFRCATAVSEIVLVGLKATCRSATDHASRDFLELYEIARSRNKLSSRRTFS